MLKFESARSPFDVDPLVRALTVDQIRRDVKAYTELLDGMASEHVVQAFLSSHTYFFNGILRLFGWSPVYSRVKLGADFETDFAFFDSGSLGPDWCLIEIESPDKRLLTKSGDPSAALTHALQQVRNWNAWIHENLDYARKLMPHIEYPLSYVFMGRRADLGPFAKKQLRRIAYDHRAIVRLHTLDWFASAAASVIGLLGDGHGGRWPVPMNAFTHSDLAGRIPAPSFDWMERPEVRERGRSVEELRQSERLHGYLRGTEYDE